MTSRYRAFKYDTAVYGNGGLALAQSYILAQAIDHTSIRITLDVPERVGQSFMLVRSNHGSAEDPSDGYTVASGVLTSSNLVFVDSTVGQSSVSGTTYYTLFEFDENGAWMKDAATSVVVPSNKGTLNKMLDILPTMYTSVDGNPLSPTDFDSELLKFLYGFALTYDELSTLVDFILPENRDRYITRRLSEIFATGIGMPNEYLIGVGASARLYREAGYIYRNKGTANGIATYVEALTGWQTVVKETNNKIPTLDDGSFEESTGRWGWDSSRMSLVVQAIDGVTAVGPDIEYETSDYPFSRMGVGHATLLGSTARMTLPGSGDIRLGAIPVRPGKTHFFAVPVQSVTGSPAIIPSVEWLDYRGVTLSVSTLADTSASTDWQVAGGPVLAPADATFAVLHIDISGIAGDEVYLDMLSFTEEVARFRTNFFLNPSAEADVDDVELVDPAAGTLSTTTDQVRFGTRSFLLQASSATPVSLGMQDSALIEAADGQTFTGSVYLYSTIETVATPRFQWISNGTPTVLSTSPTTTIPANEWTRIHYTVTAPTGTTHLQFGFTTDAVFSGTDSLYADGFMVEQTDRLGDFVAGSTGTTYGASGRYGDFIYSTYDVGYIYRDPRSVTIICQPDRVNLVFDPSFEVDPTPWTVDAGSLVSSGDQHLTGLSSGKASGETWSFKTNAMPVIGDYTYSIASAAWSASGTAEVAVRWYDYSDSLLREDTVAFDSLSENWTTLDGTFAAPRAAVYAVAHLTGTGTVYIDNVLFERADRPQVFFSGNIADADNQDGRWSGSGPSSYSLLYDKAPIKLGRLKQTLPYYLPIGVSARVLLWDSADPEVQALIPRGIYK